MATLETQKPGQDIVTKEVRNLGWLLRRPNDELRQIEVRKGVNGNDAFLVVRGSTDSYEWVYTTDFASKHILADFISKRDGRWGSVSFRWFNRDFLNVASFAAHIAP